jgi:cyanobactin maturation PatA/PatG family protease
MGPPLPFHSAAGATAAPSNARSQFASIPGLAALWEETKGDRQVCVGVLDTPLDLADPCLGSTEINQAWDGDFRHCSRHGSEVASIIFAPHNSYVLGIAPACSGVSIPIFDCDPDRVASSQQGRLASAILDVTAAGADIINISAGQLVSGRDAEPTLMEAVRRCASSGALIVAAAGNDGCNCLHVPAALPCVLSVGAMRRDGRPLSQSNWGSVYGQQGILATGEDIPVAGPYGQPVLRTGTSYATAIVSGVAALLLSRELKLGRPARPHLIRKALLVTAVGCDRQTALDCRRFLAGRLNITGAISLLDRWSTTMTSDMNFDPTSECGSMTDDGCDTRSAPASIRPLTGGVQFERPVTPSHQSAAEASPKLNGEGLQTSACASCRGERQLVYALGQLGYDFGSEAGLDAYKHRMQHMPHPQTSAAESGARSWREANPLDESHLVTFLEAMTRQNEPWHASGLHWTLTVGGMPIYAIKPDGPYAREAYERLRQFFGEQFEQKAERIAVPGVIAGQATLLNGQHVPIINPDLRGLSNWPTEGLIEAVLQAPVDTGATPNADDLRRSFREFLDRIYFELRNVGLTPQERALNYAGTNLFSYRQILGTLHSRRALDTIHVERSSICRPGSDCWDITVAFFDPDQPLQTVRTIYRYTVDVSDVLPVTVGDIRSWSARV